MTPSIIFDFDGTLAVGRGPVLAYARCVADAARPGYVGRVEAALDAHDSGDRTHRDGYDVVGSLAAADGVDAAAIGAAYARSRRMLGTPEAPVDTMADLDSFLEGLGRHARLILATNAPAEGVDAVLDSWGVRDRFDAIHVTVGKPAGLSAVVRDALALGPVLAIGDIVEFDLAPAQDLGADTALVGPTADASPASVSMRGESLAALRAAIEDWAVAAAASLPPVSPDTDTRIER